jgi:hypothetical protein
MIMTMGSGVFFLFSLPFLELEPKYECNLKGVWSVCHSQIFCSDPTIEWRVKWDDQETLDNLIIQFEFYCQPSYMIGLFGACFLAGIVVGSVTIARLGDILGRKPVFLYGIIA